MSFQRYPAYRDSGVETVSDIPFHWKTSRLKFLFDLVKRLPEENDEIVTAFRDGFVSLRKNRRVDGFTNSINDAGYQRVLRGDLVIHSMDAFSGAVGVSDSDGKSTPVYSVCQPKSMTHAQYYGYLLRALALSGFITSLAKGIRERSTEFRWAEAGNVELPVPPFEEQKIIATFLDRETARIDALVTEQEKLIDLLKEKRQAVISRAVTKGLDPQVPMKDSGIAWLGEVPAHWEVMALKRLIVPGSSISYGIVQPGEHVEDGIPFVQTTNMTSGNFALDSLQRTSPEIASNYPRSRLFGGEVLLGIRASIGAAHVAPRHLESANLSRGVARIECNETINEHFLVSYLRSTAVETYWQLAKQGSTFNEVSIETVKELSVIIPPRGEQTEICKAVCEWDRQFSELMRESLIAITLLKERRAALISAAVTGRIDVRDRVAAGATEAA